MLTVKCIDLGPLHANCYIVFNNKNEAILIDPGDEAERLLLYIGKLKLNIKYIILTHAHFDHFSAAQAMYEKFGCPLIVHRDDVILLSDPHLNLSVGFIGSSVVYTGKQISVTEEKTEILSHTFEFIHTPGHSPGSMCIMIDDMLFTGDTLFYKSIGNSFPPYGSIQTELSSIKSKLLTLEGDYVCYPGHGQSTTLEYEKANNPYLI